jgi:hypothetical protein
VPERGRASPVDAHVPGDLPHFPQVPHVVDLEFRPVGDEEPVAVPHHAVHVDVARGLERTAGRGGDEEDMSVGHRRVVVLDDGDARVLVLAAVRSVIPAGEVQVVAVHGALGVGIMARRQTLRYPTALFVIVVGAGVIGPVPAEAVGCVPGVESGRVAQVGAPSVLGRPGHRERGHLRHGAGALHQGDVVLEPLPHVVRGLQLEVVHNGQAELCHRRRRGSGRSGEEAADDHTEGDRQRRQRARPPVSPGTAMKTHLWHRGSLCRAVRILTT